MHELQPVRRPRQHPYLNPQSEANRGWDGPIEPYYERAVDPRDFKLAAEYHQARAAHDAAQRDLHAQRSLDAASPSESVPATPFKYTESPREDTDQPWPGIYAADTASTPLRATIVIVIVALAAWLIWHFATKPADPPPAPDLPDQVSFACPTFACGPVTELTNGLPFELSLTVIGIRADDLGYFCTQGYKVISTFNGQRSPDYCPRMLSTNPDTQLDGLDVTVQISQFGLVSIHLATHQPARPDGPAHRLRN